MKFYIGIDGGGTKTKFTLVNEEGTFIASNTQKTIHYLQCGLDTMAQRISDGINQCLMDASLKRQDITSIFVGCPGYGDIENDKSLLEETIHNVINPIKHAIGNDTDNALAGSLAGHQGICVIAGTGSIGLGIDDEGKHISSGGWHHAFGGDEGSAHWLACRFIQEFTKQADNRTPRTELFYKTMAKYKFQNSSEMLDLLIHDLKFDRTKIADLATNLFELANENDPCALAIYKEAANELALIVRSIYTQTHYKNKALVSYAGGVFRSGHFILEPFKDALSDLNVDVVTPSFEPDIGSVILAMKIDNHELNPSIVDALSQS